MQAKLAHSIANTSALRLLKRRQISGPEQCAIATVHLLREVVAKSKWSDVDRLLQHVQLVGKKLVTARPQELVTGNVVRRVLGLIRDEADEDRNGDGNMDESMSDISALPSDEPNRNYSSPPRTSARPPALSSASSFHVPQSMFNLLSGEFKLDGGGIGSPFGRGSGSSTPLTNAQPASIAALRSEVIDGIDEIKDEISQVDEQIGAFAEVQIHPCDYVLVYQPSPTVERFLVKAAKNRKFTVLLAGASPPKTPDDVPYAALRKKLAHSGVTIINIAGSGVMAYMPRVHKVILGARAVTASGAVVADAGAALVARAAHEYKKPVVVLAGVFKLCPEDEPDLDSVVDLGNPSSLVDYADGPLVAGMDVESTASEFISPELVDIYITNL